MEAETTVIVPESALKRKWHQLEPDEYGVEFRELAGKQPVVKYAGLQPHKAYYDKSSYSPAKGKVFRVLRITPSGSQVSVVFLPSQEEDKLFRGSFSASEFMELNDDLLSYMGVLHEHIVYEAYHRGMEIPPQVRRHYPQCWVTVRDRFAGRKHPLAHDLTAQGWRNPPPGPKHIERWIEHHHKELEGLAHLHARWAGGDGPHVEDIERWIAEHRADIEYYRWLIPLVSEGGPFYIPGLPEPGEENPTAPPCKVHRKRLPFPEREEVCTCV